jgi:hypothetical protein
MNITRLNGSAAKFLSILFLGVCVVAGTENKIVAMSPESIQNEWLKQYDELKAKIASSLSKQSSDLGDRYVVDRNVMILPEDRDPLDVTLRRTTALLHNLEKQDPRLCARLAAHEKRLANIQQSLAVQGLSKTVAANEVQRKALYLQTCALRRELLVNVNPAVDFDTLIFAGWMTAAGDYHMCDQWYGWNAQNGGGLYKLAGLKSSATSADYFLVRFNGTQISLFGRKNPGHGIAAVSIDSGAETSADFYAATEATQALVYASPTLTSGSHVLKVRVTGTKNAASTGTYVVPDFVTIVSGTTVTVNDRTIGTGLNQFNYMGAGWATQNMTGDYNGDETYHIGTLSAGGTALINILNGATVQNGRLAGRSLTPGEFISPDLSYDGKTILFAWSNQVDSCYHIFKVNADGSGLTQLTDGRTQYNADPLLMNMSKNDFDPCWLPGGRIAFISERRGGYLRCSGARPCPTYTLYGMKADGSDIYPLSYHETNEWAPSVDNNGMIVYTRWDYIDRDDCIAHHIWICGPDGTNPRSYHGNYPNPQSTQTGSAWVNEKYSRPNIEEQIRAIPNSSKYSAIAGAHHGHHFGQIIVIDPNIPDDNKMSQVKGITSNQTYWPDATGPYGTPWPLSETYFLCNKNNSIILCDASGNEEVLYTSTAFRPLEPIPLRARTAPPTLTSRTWQGDRATLATHYRATVSIMNVYESDQPLPAGVTIKSLRIIQIFPEQQPIMNIPRIGFAGESLVRIPLGTVPVETDGSAYFEAPVSKEIYFQLLDSLGCAVQSMRSGTYAHAGEQMSCFGCHEDKWKAPPPISNPLALRRAPSKIIPEAGGLEPINFHRLVEPIFTAKCASCHASQGKGPSMSYASLDPYAFYFPSNSNTYLTDDIITPIHGGSRSVPGRVGARYAAMYKDLFSSHHNVNLTASEFRSIVLWLDCNSNELGSYSNEAGQRAGQLVWPAIDTNLQNPSGVESDFPLPTTAVRRRVLDQYLTNPAVIFPVTLRFSGGVFSISKPAGTEYTLKLCNLNGKTVYRAKLDALVTKNVFSLRSQKLAPAAYIAVIMSMDNRVVRSMPFMMY